MNDETQITPEPNDKDFKFNDETSTQQPKKLDVDQSVISWEAPDSFSGDKNPKKLVLLVILTLILAFIIYLLTKDKISTGVVLVCGFVFGFYSFKKPKNINYSFNSHGFEIKNKQYSFGNFKSFGLIQYNDNQSVFFVPLKRFMPSVYLNLEQKVAPEIIQRLSTILPIEKSKIDLSERLSRFIKI